VRLRPHSGLRLVPAAWAASLGGFLLALTIAGPASAGTLHVQLGTSQTTCTAFTQSWFSPGELTGTARCNIPPDLGGGYGWDVSAAAPTVTAGAAGRWQINAPAGITIERAQVPSINSAGLVTTSQHGWLGRSFWSGGYDPWGVNTASAYDGAVTPVNSSYWGFQLYCNASTCNNRGYLQVPQVDLTATEIEAPQLIAVGWDNLWYQGEGYVWNPPGDPWSADIEASDPSGICDMYVLANTDQIDGPTATPNADSFQQCPSPVDWTPSQGAAIDTNKFVPPGTSGAFGLELVATNAAGVTTNPSEAIQVDNVQPTVTITTPDDPNPTVWVNHAVTVDASATTGPSGLASLNCAVDEAAPQAYPSDGISVDGDGTHMVSCTAANNATDPQGDPNTGSGSVNVAIDEAPPSVQFEPTDPSNPTQLIVDTSDSESGVAGGTIEMRAASGGTWQPLATQFDGQHLISSFDDAGRSGQYVFQATSCDQVGNCAATDEQLKLPVRLAASSDVSFQRIVDPLVAYKVRERLRVGWHWATVRRHGRIVRVRRGGHIRTITVIRWRVRCAITRTRTGSHRWSVHTTCRLPRLKLTSVRQVAFGKPVTVRGLLISGEGVPIANAAVQVLTAPGNGLNQYTAAAAATTDAHGAWSATLPPGPSRLIRAVYGGSATVLPATGEATVTVPARIAISISPRSVPWSGTVTIRGHLVGGYVPPDGVAMRLLIWLPHRSRPYSPVPFRTDPRGAFQLRWSFATGVGVATYPISVATTATESDFPFAAGASRAIPVTFGARLH
jgi:hypothetical protein